MPIEQFPHANNDDGKHCHEREWQHYLSDRRWPNGVEHDATLAAVIAGIHRWTAPAALATPQPCADSCYQMAGGGRKFGDAAASGCVSVRGWRPKFTCYRLRFFAAYSSSAEAIAVSRPGDIFFLVISIMVTKYSLSSASIGHPILPWGPSDEISSVPSASRMTIQGIPSVLSLRSRSATAWPSFISSTSIFTTT